MIFANGALVSWLAPRPAVGGRIYLDTSDREGAFSLLDRLSGGRLHSRPYLCAVRATRAALLAKGYREGIDLLTVEDPGARHCEADWGRRLPQALRFLLADAGRDAVEV